MRGCMNTHIFCAAPPPAHFSTMWNTHEEGQEFLLNEGFRIKISGLHLQMFFLGGIYESLNHDVHSVYQPWLPSYWQQPVSQLYCYLNVGFVGELEIHLKQTAHYQRVGFFFFFKIKLTYYLIAPKTTKRKIKWLLNEGQTIQKTN